MLICYTGVLQTLIATMYLNYFVMQIFHSLNNVHLGQIRSHAFKGGIGQYVHHGLLDFMLAIRALRYQLDNLIAVSVSLGQRSEDLYNG